MNQFKATITTTTTTMSSAAEVVSITKNRFLPHPACDHNVDDNDDDSFGFFLDEEDEDEEQYVSTEYAVPLNDQQPESSAPALDDDEKTQTTVPLEDEEDNETNETNDEHPLVDEDIETKNEPMSTPPMLVIEPFARKSSMKSLSSYGSMEIIGEGIPLNSDRRAFKTLPPPSAAATDKNKAAIQMRRTASSASFFQHLPPPPEGPLLGSPGSTMKREVSFSKVHVRGYEQTIGDNPSVSYGTPISLDWNYEEKDSLSLDDYERHRPSADRRDMRGMMLNYYQRNELLSRNGFSVEDVQAAKKQIEKLQRQRGLTKFLLPVNKLEDIAESALRKTKRAVFGMKKNASTGCLDQIM